MATTPNIHRRSAKVFSYPNKNTKSINVQNNFVLQDEFVKFEVSI